MATIEIWTFAVATPPNVDLTGFKVDARDGSIGKVDEATHEAAGSFIVVDTGPWIFGKKVMIPAGALVNGHLYFQHSGTISAKALGLSGDERSLAVAYRSFVFRSVTK